MLVLFSETRLLCTDLVLWKSLASALLRVSHLYSIRGTPKSAEHYATQAVDLARDLGSPRVAARAYIVRGEVKMKAGNLVGCEEDMETAVSLLGTVSALRRFPILLALTPWPVYRALVQKPSMLEDSGQTYTSVVSWPARPMSHISRRNPCSTSLLLLQERGKCNQTCEVSLFLCDVG